jgi:hypothetical protein
MTFQVPTFVSADNAGNEADSTAWPKVIAAIRAANAGQFQAGKNFIRNGSFEVWQRGTSIAPSGSSAGTLSADRWRGRRAGGVAGMTMARTAGLLNGSRYAMRWQRDSGNTDTSIMYLAHYITTEDATRMAGKTMRLSLVAQAGANFSPTSSLISAAILTGTGTDELPSLLSSYATGPATAAGGGNFNPTTTAARYEIGTFTMPAGMTEAYLRLACAPVGTAGAADYVDLDDVQLEIVDSTDQIATPFERIPFAEELAYCQRFYRKSFLYPTAPAQNVGNNTGEHFFRSPAGGAVSQGPQRVMFYPSMHALPTPTVTVTLFNPAAANAQARDQTAAADCSSTTASNVTTRGFELNTTGNASTSAGNKLGVHWTAEVDY